MKVSSVARATIRFRGTVVIVGICLLVISATACGITFNNSASTDTNNVTLSGTVSETVAKPSAKPSIGTQSLRAALAGGELKVLNAKGETLNSATIGTDGSYSVSVTKGSNYTIRATKGNVCLKSFLEKADADKTVTVDPTSSAVVKVLGKKIGNDKLGEEGEDVSSAVDAIDISSIIVAIKNSGLLTTIGQAIRDNIASGANYSSTTTATIGVNSTAGDGDANTLSVSITITITIIGQGNAPSAPTGVTAAAGNGKVTVSWNSVTGATSYNLYYSTSAGTAGIKINGITTGTSYTITGLSNGITYHFSVSASSGNGEGAASSQVSVTPQSSLSNLLGGAIQGSPLTLAGTVTTFAGSALISGTSDGMGTTARFSLPTGITTDGTNLFVADWDNHTVRKVVIATGTVTTLAGSARVAGSTDGTGTAALFHGPFGITTDGVNLYVADRYNHTIRKVVIATGTVTTLAGSAGVAGSSDGTGSAARFNDPLAVTTDGTNLYLSDSGSHTIRKVVIASGVVTTLVGSAGVAGSINGTGTAALLNGPIGITMDGANLYVVEGLNCTIRKVVIATGVVATLAGSAGITGSTDGTGTAARFSFPRGITTDGTNLYVTDGDNHTLRKVAIATGVLTTLAGSAGITGSADGTGTSARFYQPYGITTDGVSVYLTDSSNSTIRKIQ